jgi:hypothetical protein
VTDQEILVWAGDHPLAFLILAMVVIVWIVAD